MKSLTNLLFALLVPFLVALPSYAGGHLSGTVYQLEPNSVYVTAPDHSVMLVPAATATFRVHGVAVDFRDLAIGTPVDVDYQPVYGFQAFYGVNDPNLAAGTVIYHPVAFGHEGVIPARYIWYNGSWHRQ